MSSGGWPVELVALNDVTLGAVVWRMGALPLHVTVVVVATMRYGAAGMTLAEPGALSRERGRAPVRKVPASSDLAPFLPRADVWVTGVPVSARIVVGRERVLIDKRGPAAALGLVPAVARLGLCGGVEPEGLASPLMMVPASFDLRFFQAAPEDQRCPFLAGDEWLELDEGLRPSVRLVLPRVQAAVRAGEHDVRLWIDGLRIDGARRRVRLRWRGCFAIDGVEALRGVRIAGGVSVAGAPIPWERRRGGATVGMSPDERARLLAELDVLRAAATTVPVDQVAATVEQAPLLESEGRDTLLMSMSDEVDEMRRVLGIPVGPWTKTLTLDDDS